jgi:hypothetical protein
MAGDRFSTHELAPPVPDELTPEQGIEEWRDLMSACDQLLFAGLQRSAGPDGDIQSVYREWYAQQMEEHDRTMHRLMEEFQRRGSDRGR